MAKYVCDFEQVYAAGEKLCSMAMDLESSVSNYGSKISGDLSSWTGEAKGNFTTQCEGQVQLATAGAQKANELGEFIKEASKSIQALDDELASLSI